MKKQILVLFIFLSIHSLSYADCPTDNVILTSQAQIDAFASYYTGCKIIDYNVTIKEDVDGDITNLNGLTDIETINGDFYITENSALSDLSGLSKLNAVNGDFYIFKNSSLQNLNGLGALNTVSGAYFYIGQNDNLVSFSGINSLTTVAADNLYIGYNDNLENLNGLGTIATIDGVLTIEYNDNLLNLSGLSSLGSVGGNLLIGDNYALESISDLSALSSVGGYLWLGPNPDLPSLNGLDNLNTIGEGIWIGRNSSLTDLTALSGITSLGDYLMIDENNSLQSLDGLHNITSLSTLLWFGNNSSLTDISMDNLSSVDGDLLINNNALVNLNGLNSLNSINGYLHIIGNYELNNIEGIGQLDHNTINNLSIYSNSKLSECSVESVCSYLQIADPHTDIHDNSTNCNNDSEVEGECSPLPIKWGEPLEARAEESFILLTGSILQQSNIRLFSIERSSDGYFYEKLAEVPAEDHLLLEKYYQYEDSYPYVGDNYYRVKSIDYDGKFTYSNITRVSYSKNSVSFFPNPLINQLNVNSDKESVLDVYSSMGELVLHKKLDIGLNSYDVSKWKSGVYFTRELGGESRKIIKR